MFKIYARNRVLWQMLGFLIFSLSWLVFTKSCYVYLNIYTLASLNPHTNTVFNPLSTCSSAINSQLFYLQGMQHYHLGELNKATTYLTPALNNSNKSQLIYLRLGQILFEQGLEYQAVDVWKKGHVENYFITQGHFYLNQKDWINAVKYYQQSLNINPYHKNALWGIGIAYRNQSLWPEAIQAYQTYLNLQPEDKDVRYNLGLAFLQINKISLARQEASQLIKLDPEFPLGLLLMAHTFRIEGQSEKAIEWYMTVVSSPSSSIIYKLLAQKYIGITYLETNQADKALTIFEDIVSNQNNLDSGEQAEIYFYLSSSFEQLGNLDQAIIAAEQAITLNPSPLYQYKLANLYESTQQYYQAQQIYINILTSYPSDPLAMERLNVLRNVKNNP